MSTRDSRYWNEVRLCTAARVLLDTMEKPGDSRLKEAKEALEAAVVDMVGYATNFYLDDSEGICGGCGLVGQHADEDCPEYGEDRDEADPNVDVRLSVCCKAKLEMVLGELRCEQCGERHRDDVRTTPQRWNED